MIGLLQSVGQKLKKKMNSDMIEIYIHSCASCGLLGARIAKVKRHHPDVKVIDTRNDKAALERHIEYLKHSGIDMSEYTPIVVDTDTKVITRLSDWKKSSIME